MKLTHIDVLEAGERIAQHDFSRQCEPIPKPIQGLVAQLFEEADVLQAGCADAPVRGGREKQYGRDRRRDNKSESFE